MVVGVQESLNASPQSGVAGARFVQELRPFFGRGLFDCRSEYRFFVHEMLHTTMRKRTPIPIAESGNFVKEKK
jgi:hypothetical protein